MERIQLPLTFILSNDARIFLRQNNIHASNVHLSDGRVLPGIRINKYHMNFLQSFLFNGYLISNEICITDIAQERAAFMDIAKGFVYAALYRRFDCASFDMLDQFGIVSLWNRKNSRFLITYERRNQQKVASWLANKKNYINTMQNAVSDEAINYLKTLGPLKESEGFLKQITRKFLVNCSPVTKLLIYLMKHNNQLQVYKEFGKLLTSYIQKASIADYFSMLLVELILQVSMHETNLLHTGENNIEELLNSHNTQKKAPKTYVIWNFNTRQNIPRERVLLRIAFSNKKSEYHNLHSRLTSDTDEVLRHTNIQEYYLSSSDPEKEAKLGLSYLFYVEQECKRLKLHFESFVSSIPDLEQTLYNVSLLI